MPAAAAHVGGRRAAGGSNYWINDAGNVGISTIYAVGIGTTFVGGTGEASFAVMNGNVGIGTWVPGGILDVEGGSAKRLARMGPAFKWWRKTQESWRRKTTTEAILY